MKILTLFYLQIPKGNLNRLVACTFLPNNPWDFEFGEYVALLNVDNVRKCVSFRGIAKDKVDVSADVDMDNSNNKSSFKYNADYVFEQKITVSFFEFQTYIYDIIFCMVPVDVLVTRQRPNSWTEKAIYQMIKGLCGAYWIEDSSGLVVNQSLGGNPLNNSIGLVPGGGNQNVGNSYNPASRSRSVSPIARFATPTHRDLANGMGNYSGNLQDELNQTVASAGNGMFTATQVGNFNSTGNMNMNSGTNNFPPSPTRGRSLSRERFNQSLNPANRASLSQSQELNRCSQETWTPTGGIVRQSVDNTKSLNNVPTVF